MFGGFPSLLMRTVEGLFLSLTSSSLVVDYIILKDQTRTIVTMLQFLSENQCTSWKLL